MILISKKSQFYKYVDSSFIAHVADLTPRVPDNLCPFMRRILFLFFMELLFFSFAAIFFVGPVLAIPLSFFLPGFFDTGYLVLGTIWWMLGVALLTVFLLDRYAKERLNRTCDRIAAKNSFQTTMSWLHAVHDKICPEVKFDD